VDKILIIKKDQLPPDHAESDFSRCNDKNHHSAIKGGGRRNTQASHQGGGLTLPERYRGL